eukprot:Skav231837  [mRNA]  locus=scaffold2215:120435:120866:+ [translate_table: standard]
MSLSVFGLMLPLLHLLGAPTLPAPILLSFGSLLLYCFLAWPCLQVLCWLGLPVHNLCPGVQFALASCLLRGLIAGSIWWNHLLGGAGRWAKLSGELASQLVDQADAAAGIAFLTRDWAEMARRSLVALDQDAELLIFSEQWQQ